MLLFDSAVRFIAIIGDSVRDRTLKSRYSTDYAYEHTRASLRSRIKAQNETNEHVLGAKH